MLITTPLGYYDRYEHNNKNWKKILFNPRRSLQASELIEIQSILASEHEYLAKNLVDEGAILSGVNFTINLEENIVNISTGAIYANGFVHEVPAGFVTITGTGREEIGVKILPVVVTEDTDPSLKNPVIGSENYKWVGSHRLTYLYDFTVDDPSAITIGVLIDGVLSSHNSQPRPVSDKILKLLAERTYDESGNYSIAPFKISVARLNNITEALDYEYKLRLKVDGGKAYVKGWKVTNTVATKVFNRTVAQELSDINSPDILDQLDESQAVENVYNETPLLYKLFNAPLNRTLSVSAKVQTPYYSITRANSDTDSLLKLSQFPLMTSIYTVDEVYKYVSGNSGATITYTAGVDYYRAGNLINWNTGGGSEPAVGETYYVKSTYQRQMVKAKRVLTSVTGELVYKGTGLSTDILNSGSGRECHAILKIYSNNIEYHDYTPTLYNGRITWTGNSKPASGSTYSVDYEYWDHVIEGDFVARDSFVDSSNNVLLYKTPTATALTGSPIDYKTSITFETASISTPKAETDILFSYNFILPRIDAISINRFGDINIIKGIPSINPTIPVEPSEDLLIATIYLPPEATPDIVRITYEDNATLTMEELRSVLYTVKKMNYNDAVFHLHQKTMNKPLPTDKLGIIADNFNSHLLSDVGNAEYATTLDYLSGHCMLPQTHEIYSLTPSISTTAKYVDNYYLLPYSDVNYIEQPYATESVLINEYSLQQINARIFIYPPVDRWTSRETIQTETVVNTSSPSESFTLLINNTARGETVPTRFSGTLEFFRELFVNGWSSSPSIPETNSPLRRLQPESWWVEFTNSIRGATTAPTGFTLGDITWSSTGVQETTQVDPGWTNIITNQVSTLVSTARSCPVYLIGEEFVPGEHVTCYFDNNKVDLIEPEYLGSQYKIPYETDPSPSIEFTTPLPKIVRPLPTNSNGYVTIAKPVGITSTSNEDGTITVGSNGKWIGVFYVPENTAVGNHEIIVVGTGDEDYSATKLLTEFSSTGYLNSIYEYVTTQPPSRVTNRTLNITISQGLSPEAAIAPPVVTPPAANNPVGIGWAPGMAGGFFGSNMLDQTFLIKEECFLTKVDIYFHIKPTKSVTVEVKEVIAGMPAIRVLGTVTLSPEDCSDSTDGTVATTFVFKAPVFVEADKEYAIVIATDDPLAKVWIARLNGTDPNLGWVNTNPYTGVLLKSSNSSTWTPIQNCDLKFTLYRAEFESNATINFDTTNFIEDRNRFEYMNQCVEPGDNTHVRYQCSSNGTMWRDFTPPIEFNLGQLVPSLQTRISLFGGGKLSPIVYNNFYVNGYSWELEGNYILRMFTLEKDAVAGSLDVWIDTYIPSGTTISVKACYDGSLVNYVNVPYVSNDDIRINENGWYEKHYMLDAGVDGLNLSQGQFPLVDNYTSLHIIVQMTSNDPAITPIIASYRASANDLPA